MSGGRTPILYLAPWVDLGGSDKGTIDWFKAIDRQRWAPYLVTTQPSPNRWLGGVVGFAEEIWDLPDLMPGAAFPEFILGFIESREVEVVHIMNSRLALDLLPDIAALANAPKVVVQMHAEEPNGGGYVRYAARRFANLIDGFSVTSRQLAEALAAYEVPPSRIDVIHSGVDSIGEFDPDATAPLRLDGALPRVLWPARLTEQKDPLLTLDVLLAARELGTGFVLDVVGDGPMLGTVRERAAELGLEDAIAWHPPSREMPRWYRSADLMLMTSAYEGVPYAIYEALAMEVPVVVPDLPGNAEFMDADSGLLIAPRDDARAYAEAIDALLGDDDRRRAMGRLSRERMLRDFSLASMGERHEALYRRLLERDRVTTASTAAAEGAAPPSLRLERDPPPPRSVGVVVPCYRHGLFLGACVASIQRQTLLAERIVVVDDGSDDEETIAALARLDDDPTVTVVRLPENRGPAAARNRGLADLDTSYTLAIDADDELLPDALERMVDALEAAPPEVGFVYPNTQFTGNRHDYVASPAYNLWLLMQQNYCPAPALFDRRVFAAGASYPEAIRTGHEDWDLVLALAERQLVGVPVDGPTFLYRQAGVSRANAVDFAPRSFDRTIADRHPALYGAADEIKATWAPALSIVILDDGSGEWGTREASDADSQRCRDFELVDAAANASLGEAIGGARGRWVLLLPVAVAGALSDPTLVEKLLRGFIANEGTAAIVLATGAAESGLALAQLDDVDRLAATPAALAFERPSWGRMPDVDLTGGGSLLEALALGLQETGLLQWRVLPSDDPSPAPVAGERDIDLNLRSEGSPAGAARAMALHCPPRLPGRKRDAPRRASGADLWTPPRSFLLHRYVHRETGERRHTPGAARMPGFELEHVLGSTRQAPAPGARRLLEDQGAFALADEMVEGSVGAVDLGYIEVGPLPMLLSLELRRIASGQQVLVAGGGDPLLFASEYVETLGYVEPYPLLPFAGEVVRFGPWGVVALRRRVDRAGWRHAYATAPVGADGVGVTVGLLARSPRPGLVPLRRRGDGRLVSDLHAPGRASRNPRRIARWLVGRSGDPSMAPGGSLARLVRLSRRPAAATAAEGSEGGVVLGYLRRQNGPGSATLYSTVHPVTGDQIATRFPAEAASLGYVRDGILGSIFEPAESAEP